MANSLIPTFNDPYSDAMSSINIINEGAAMSVAGSKRSANAARAAGQLAAESFNAAGSIAVQGFNYAAQAARGGANLNAAVYRNSGKAALTVADYNESLNRQEESRASDALARQIAPLMSTNRATAAQNGFSFGSGSYLAVTSQVMSNLESQIRQDRNTAKQQRDQIHYEGLLTNMQYENQARAAEYAGETAATSYEYQAKAASIDYGYKSASALLEADTQARNADLQGQITQYNADVANQTNINKLISQGFDPLQYKKKG